MRTLHLFAGGGGGLLADLILGHNPVAAVEWDHDACQVLRERAREGWFPELEVYEGDVRLFDASKYKGRVDCIHAGFPCQDISSAGKKEGIGEGTRSNLYVEAVRVFREVRPKYLFLENVAATLSPNIIGRIFADLAQVGFSEIRWICLRASDVGAPHRRDRWWALASNSTEVGPHEISKFQKTKCIEVDFWMPCKFNSLLHGCKIWTDSECGASLLGDGLSDWMVASSIFGNAQVPLQAAVAFKILSEGLL